MKFRLVTALLTFGFASLTGFAAEKKPGPPSPSPSGQISNAPEWDKLFRGVALPAVWQSAQGALAKIDAALHTKSWPDIAEQAEKIHLAAHALDDQVKLGDIERQKRLRGALSQAAKIADDVIDAAEHKEPEKLAEALRRLNAAIRLAAMRLPKEITDAPK